MVHRVLRSITDLGPLTDLLARRDVEEIFIEGAAGHVPRQQRSAARPRRADERGREPADPRPAARGNGSPAQREAPDGPGAGARRQRAADRRHPSGRRLLVGDRAALHGARRHPRRARRRATRSLRRPPRSSGRLMQLRSRIVISGEPGAGKTTLRGRGAGGVAGESLRPVLRGDPRARGSVDARGVLRGPAGRPRRHRRDLAPRPGQVRPGDASRPHRGRARCAAPRRSS